MINWLKRLVFKALKKTASVLGYKLEKKSKPLENPGLSFKILFFYLTTQLKRKLNVVVVGANDGITNDKLFQGNLSYADRILLIEPQTHLIPMLTANYEAFKGAVTIKNIAIGPHEGEIELYSVVEEVRKEFLKNGFDSSQFASFNKEHVEKHLRLSFYYKESLDLDKIIQHTKVQVFPLNNVLLAHQFDTVDVLQVDCEGYDFNVIKTLSADNLPSLINCEWKHLNELDRLQLLQWFQAHHYVHLIHGEDCLAIRHSLGILDIK